MPAQSASRLFAENGAEVQCPFLSRESFRQDLADTDMCAICVGLPGEVVDLLLMSLEFIDPGRSVSQGEAS